jgi:hypothetical protein
MKGGGRRSEEKRRRDLEFRTTTRASESSWRSPAEKLEPSSCRRGGRRGVSEKDGERSNCDQIETDLHYRVQPELVEPSLDLRGRVIGRNEVAAMKCREEVGVRVFRCWVEVFTY